MELHSVMELHSGWSNRGIFDAVRARNCNFLCPPRFEVGKQALGGHIYNDTVRIGGMALIVAGSPFPGIPTNFILITDFDNRFVVDFSI